MSVIGSSATRHCGTAASPSLPITRPFSLSWYIGLPSTSAIRCGLCRFRHCRSLTVPTGTHSSATRLTSVQLPSGWCSMLMSRFGSGGGWSGGGVSCAVRCGPWQWRQCTSNSTRPARAFCSSILPNSVSGHRGASSCRERALDLVQAVRMDRGVVAQVQRQRRAEFVEQVEPRADAERLVDVARHRLRRVALPLHPVELGDVPQVRIAHRRRRRTVVVRRDVPAEHRVGDALRGVGAAVALEHRVAAVLQVGPGVGEQRADRSAELGAQLAPRGVEVEALPPCRRSGAARSRCARSD